MKDQVILAGFGGQGMMLCGMLLAYSGMVEGKEVCWLPSYGPEMRGGTANCHVTLSDKPISSPVISRATSEIVMNKPSLEKFEPMLGENGILVINSSLIDEEPKRKDIRVYSIPVNEIAAEIGNDKVANIVAMGAFIELTGILEKESCFKAIDEVLGKKNAKLLPINRRAFETGAEYARGIAK